MHGTKHSMLFIEDVLEERSVMWVSIDESEVGCVLEESIEQWMCIYFGRISVWGMVISVAPTRMEPNMKTCEYENKQT